MSLKKRQDIKSQKQSEEVEEKEQHLWRQRKKQLVEIRYRELENESNEDSSSGRREYN